VVIAAYNIGFATIYGTKKQKDQWWLFMASSNIAKGLFKWETWKSIKIAQLDMVFFKCSAAMHFKRKPMTGPIII
jgi:hypothetical protein